MKKAKETKMESKGADSYKLPVSILSDRSLATLEAIVEYMKDVLGLSYHEIAELLKRNDRTIWTCYHRAKRKRVNGRQKMPS